MRELLTYAFVLAVGGAIGAYTVLSLEDGAGRPAQREAMAANFEPAPPATLTLMPANNERGLSRRPGPLAPYAQTSTAKVERLPLAEGSAIWRRGRALGHESCEQAHFSGLASLS